jgi:hypothetical protein
MNKLMLCALLAMAPLAQAASGAVSDDQNFETIAQVAIEAAQLLPSNRLGASPSTKALRGASPARVMTPSPKTKVVNADHFMPSALQSKYMNDAEQFAKANGCPAPVAKMNFAVVGVENFETFTVACGSAKPMLLLCDTGQCRVR